MLQEIASRFNADLAGVPVIGDALRDLQAAVAVGAQPILVLTCLLYTSPSPRDRTRYRMPSSA